MKISPSKKDNLLKKYNRRLFALGGFLLILHLIKLFFLLMSDSIKYGSTFFALALLSTAIPLIFNSIFLYDLTKKNERIYFYAPILSIVSAVMASDNLLLRIRFGASLFAITTTALYILACVLIFILSYKILFIKKKPT